MRESSGAPSATTSVISLGTLNIRGGYNNKKFELVEQARRLKLDIVAISDIRVRGEKEEQIGDYRVYLSGVSKGKANWGVGLMVSRDLEPYISSVRFVNERVMWVDFDIPSQNIRCGSIYSPCEGAENRDLDKFYNDLTDVVCRVRNDQKIIMLGDFNARIGNRNRIFGKVAGKFGENMDPNRNGVRILDFCQATGLAITNSFFKHRRIHQVTWEDITQNRKSTIDYVIVDQDIRKFVRDTRVYRSFEIGSDHHLLGSQISIKKPKARNIRVQCQRIRIEKLQEDNVRKQFIDRIEEEYRLIEAQRRQGIEREWSRFKDTFLRIARECVGVSICKGG